MPPMRKNITTSSGSGVSTKVLPPQNLNQIMAPNSTTEQNRLKQAELAEHVHGLGAVFPEELHQQQVEQHVGDAARGRIWCGRTGAGGGSPTSSVTRAPRWAA